jgi:hypothetical protein
MPGQMIGRKAKSHAERRSAARLPKEAFPSLSGAFLRGDSSVELIDISSGGALIETDERLIPNTNICLKVVTTEGSFMLRGRVLRSMISQLKGGPRYRSGIAFDQEFPLHAPDSAEAAPVHIEEAAESQLPAPRLSSPSRREQAAPSINNNDEVDEILTLTACIAQVAPELQHHFQFSRINNW